MTYYDEISHGYEELHKEEQLKKLHVISSLLNELRITTDGKRLLDVGCGTGISTEFFCCAVGADPSEELLRIARENHPSTKFIKSSAENLPFNDNEFDGIISITAIQNFSDVEKGLKEIRRVGEEFFVLTFLKKSQKRKLIENIIQKLFKVKSIAEEDKDLIYLCVK